MGVLLEVLGVLVLIVLVFVVVLGLLSGRAPLREGEVLPSGRATVSDRHRHRWTRWRILDERRIHLYGEVDEGRDLPDRIDVVLRRECGRCGLPETKTVRGLDADRRD